MNILMNYKLLILLLLVPIVTIAQKQTFNWCFGDSAGIDFNNVSAPQIFGSGMNARGSCASVSDSSGSLLFYASTPYPSLWLSGVIRPGAIINKQHQLMPNGDTIVGRSWYHELVIVPKPGNDSIYYVFSVGVTSIYGLYYSVVDMKANGGLGAVIQKNVMVMSDEQADCVSAVKHGNGRDWWVVGRRTTVIQNGQSNNEYWTLLVSQNGIGVPSFQNIGAQNGTNLAKISFSSTGDTLLITNSCIEFPSAMAIRGDNSYTELHCNVIENTLTNGNGINLINAILLEQGDVSMGVTWDNQWNGFLTQFGITGNQNSGFVWPYNSNGVNYFPNAAPGTVTTPSIPNFLNDPCLIQSANPTPLRDARYARIAEDSLEFTSYTSEFTYKQIEFLYNKLNKDTSLLNQSTSKDSVFQTFYSYHSSSNFGIFARVDSLLRVGNLAAANTLNTSIIDTNQIESNLKEINGLIISKVLVDSALTTADSLTLFDTAWQDPLTGGRGVYFARAILFLEIEDDVENSRFGGSGLNQIEPLKQEAESEFKVFPNPTSDECMAFFSAATSKYVLELRDAVGKLLSTYEIPHGSQSKWFSVSHLSPGIYWISLKNQQNIDKHTQLIIQR
jgi:hypothetical protein